MQKQGTERLTFIIDITRDILYYYLMIYIYIYIIRSACNVPGLVKIVSLFPVWVIARFQSVVQTTLHYFLVLILNSTSILPY